MEILKPVINKLEVNRSIENAIENNEDKDIENLEFNCCIEQNINTYKIEFNKCKFKNCQILNSEFIKRHENGKNV